MRVQLCVIMLNKQIPDCRVFPVNSHSAFLKYILFDNRTLGLTEGSCMLEGILLIQSRIELESSTLGPQEQPLFPYISAAWPWWLGSTHFRCL